MPIFLWELKRFFLDYLSLLSLMDKWFVWVCVCQTFDRRFSQFWRKVFGWRSDVVLAEECYTTYFCLVKNLDIFHNDWQNVFLHFNFGQLTFLGIIPVLLYGLLMFFRLLKSLMFNRYESVLEVLLLFIKTLISFFGAVDAGIQ